MGRDIVSNYLAPHPSLRRESVDVIGFLQSRDAYTRSYLESVTAVHQAPRRWYERLAWWWLLTVRAVVGLLTGTFGRSWSVGERQLARRAQMFNIDGQATALSGVIVGHMRSVVLNAPDNGWVHTLAMEVECMRSQWFMWAELARPSPLELVLDLAMQAGLLLQCCLMYLVAPSLIHAYQVYRAEEDMFWLGTALNLLSTPGRLPQWERARAPPAAQSYYALPPAATIKDMLLCMRADEASIRHINHQLAGLTPGARTDAVAVRQFGA